MELDASLKPALEKARQLLRAYMRNHSQDYVATKEMQGKVSKSSYVGQTVGKNMVGIK